MSRNGRLFFLVLATAFPTLLLASRLSTGISLSADSLAYLYAASKLLSDGSLLNFWGVPGSRLTIHPPLYPATIALANLFAPSLEVAAIAVSIFCIVLASCLSFLLFEQIQIGPINAMLLTVGIFTHPSMQEVFWFAWSEGLYIGISLTILYTLARASDSNPFIIGSLLGVLVGCAFLTRYVGVSLLPVILVGLIAVPHWSRRERFAGTFFALMLTSLIFSVWIARNYSVDSTFLGPRTISEDTLLFSVKQVISTFGRLMVPVGWFAPFQGWIGFAGLVVLIVLIVRKFRWVPSLAPIIFPAVVLIAFHIGLTIYSQVSTVIDPIDTRLLSPVFLPAIFVLVSIIKFFREDCVRNSFWEKLGRMTVFVVAVIYLIIPPFLSARWIGHDPWGYKLLEPSEINIPEVCRTGEWPTYTNFGPYLRFLEVVEESNPLPRQRHYRRTERRDDWSSFTSAIAKSKACVVWVGRRHDEVPPIEELLGGPGEGVTLNQVSGEHGIFVFIASLSE